MEQVEADEHSEQPGSHVSPSGLLGQVHTGMEQRLGLQEPRAEDSLSHRAYF